MGVKALKGDKVFVEVVMDYEEYLCLEGHTKNVYLFSEDSARIKSNLSQRGTNEATKYFLIPRELREGLEFADDAKCQRIDSDAVTLFIYMVDKIN